MFDRRTFLKLGGVAAAGGLVLGSGLSVFGQRAESDPHFAVPETVYADPLNALTRQSFEPLLNTNFTFSQKGLLTSQLRLAEVVEGRDQGVRMAVATTSFVLIFEPIGAASLEDGIYKVSHPELGNFSMFISRVGLSGTLYQAVFSRVSF